MKFLGVVNTFLKGNDYSQELVGLDPQKNIFKKLETKRNLENCY